MKRIVLACRAYGAFRRGGMPHVAQDRAEELARQGYDVHMLTPQGENVYAEVEINGVKVHKLPGPLQAYSDDFAVECAKVAGKLQPSFIHLDSFDPARCWWKAFHRFPTVITMHGLGWGGIMSQWNRYRLTSTEQRLVAFDGAKLKLEAEGLKAAHRVLAISLHEQRVMREFYGVESHLVYNPIAPYFFENRPDSPKRTHFLCVGNPGTSLLRNFDNLIQLCAKHDLPLQVATRVARSELPEVYDKCIALVLPTYWAQGYDLAVAEAAARGRATIAFAVGSYAAETRDPSSVGYGYLNTVPLGDWEELLTRMRHAPDGADWRAQHLFTRHPTVQQHHPENHVKRWLEACE